MILWDLDKMCAVNAIPLYEGLEGLALLPQDVALPGLGSTKNNGLWVATAGEKGIKTFFSFLWNILSYGLIYSLNVLFLSIYYQCSGVIRVWDVSIAKEIYVQTNSMVSKAKEEGGLAITQLLWNSHFGSLAVVSAEHNIILHKVDTFHCLKQVFMGAEISTFIMKSISIIINPVLSVCRL